MKSQLNLDLYKGHRGGRRPGAGRKRVHSKGVAHLKREKILSRHALHINFKVQTFIRNKTCLRVLKKAIRNARSHGLSVLHFSLQSNHVHLIVEAGSNTVLTRGMRSLTITFSKGVNRGRIQRERYHLHVLRTLTETRNAVHYVLFNKQKHAKLKSAHVDQYSSLGTVKNLKKLATEAKMIILVSRAIEKDFLSEPRGWVIRKVLYLRPF